MLKLSSNMRCVTRAIFIAIAVGALSPTAHAGLFDDDEARRDIAKHKLATEAQFKEVDAKLAKLDEAIKNLGIIQIINQLDQVNGELAKLRGQNEVMVNQFEQMQKRQKDFYFDLDARIRALEGASGTTIPLTTPTATSSTVPTTGSVTAPSAPAITLVTPPVAPNIIIAPQSNSPNQGLVVTPIGGEVATVPPISGRPVIAKSAEAQLATYDVGTNAFKANQFTNAVRGYEAFLQEFPQHILAPNAMYWIGISHFNLNEFIKARAIQERLLKLYPESSKAPDAMLAIAAVQQEMADAGSARNTYQDIIARYPDSEAAVKARTRLNSRLRNGK